MLLPRRKITPVSRFSGAAAAGGWTNPTNADGTLAFWYDGADNSTIFTDAGVTTATNGQTVQQWNDKSASARNLSQATSANRPTFTTALLNGKSGVVFADSGGTATSSAMASGSFTLAQPFIVFFVFNQQDNITAGTFRIMLDDKSETGNRPIMFSCRGDIAGNASSFAGTILNYGANITTGADLWMYASFEGASSVGRFKGITEVSGTNIGTAGVTTGITISSLAGAANIFGARIFEIFGIQNYTANDKTNALSYISSKWAI